MASPAFCNRSKVPSGCATPGPTWVALDSLKWQSAFEEDEPRHEIAATGQRHLGHAFESVAVVAPDRLAFISDHGSISYGTLLAAAYSVRDALLTSSLSPGDRVVLLLPNGPEYVGAFYGALLAGAVVVPLPPDAELNRLNHAIEATEARFVLTMTKVLRRRKQPVTATPFEWSLDANFMRTRRRRPGATHDADAPAAVFFTSGSSGEPKGVTLSHRNLLANAASIIEYLGLSSNERAIGLLPFYHAFGNSILQTHLLSGASIVLAGSTMFPESILDAIETYQATSLSGVPNLFQTLLSRTTFGERELPSLRYLSVAGGRLDPDQAQTLAFRAAPATLIIMYGQTEATARLSYLPAEHFDARYGSIGKGVPGVELQVVDEQGRRVKPGVTGEIRARGPNIMLGYWNDPKATGKMIRDGWLYTGDLATVDDDGFVYPQGRKSGIVKVAGFRVHPAEIEDFVRQESGVLEAIVVPFESEAGGTRLALFVRPWRGDQTISVESLRLLCAGGLPRHKVPEHIEVLHTLPLNDSHKVDRQGLRRRVEAALCTR